MKKKLFLTIAMISVLILTGCQKETENSSVPQGESNSVKSIENDTLINNNFLYPEIAVYNENGAYLPVYSGIDGSYVVSYIDFESKSYIEVCSSVVCMHNSTECTAYISPNVGGVDLEIAKDFLIVMSKGNTVDSPPTITGMSLNGGSAKQIKKFDASDRIKAPYINSEDSIYFILEKAVVDNGKVKLKYYLTNVNLISGTSEMIAEVSENTFLRGIVDNKFLMKKIENNVHYIYTIDQVGNVNKDIYTYNQDEEYEFESDGKIYLLDYLKSTLKTINKNNEIVEVSKLNFHGTPSSTFIRIIDKDYIVVDNTTFDPKINDAITKRYSISLKEENITEINLNYFFDGRTRPMFVFGTTSKYAFGVINYKAEKLSGTDQAGNIFYYDAATPIYGIFEKKII